LALTELTSCGILMGLNGFPNKPKHRESNKAKDLP